MYSLENFFANAAHKKSLFTKEEISFVEKKIYTKTYKGKEIPYIQCAIRDKEIKLTPEEVVRQLFIYRLIKVYGYSPAQIKLEHGITFGREVKKADIVIFEEDRPTAEYIIVEVKKPKLSEGKEQLRSYCNATDAPIGVWTNGEKISFYQRKPPHYFEDIPALPRRDQQLKDILQERWKIDDLIAKDKLSTERKTLSNLIVEMEDEVLANAGVDVFEEVFKLIYTKLYDEMMSGRDKSRNLEFRNYGESDAKLKETIQKLFNNAKKKWQGVFSEDDKIKLTPSHLAICISSLQNVKLFNSNLDVIDDAFEYLMSKSQKGEKGQFFTPRYVIDMCIRMLNPKKFETMIDTAAGSCGFPVHTIFYVWKNILDELGIEQSHLFTAEQKPIECEDYVNEKVFAIDFDEKAVRVARTLNLIAGDGKTNVLHLNTIDYGRWDEAIDQDWLDVYNEGWKKLRKLRAVKNKNRDFSFDIVMANPPFAGDIKETRIIAKYELGKKPNGKYYPKVGRDILFIERNLQFLKSGGRMAIILPQGRFNNSSDKYIRDFIAERCRILAVVGLHGNVFKPHTGTKTSVLFVQKWDDELCPRRDDYPIFFATMQKPSKDNSGDKIYVPSNEPHQFFLRDNHGHVIVDHDLFNHDGLTQDGIAEAFIQFAKKEHLSFFDSSSFDETKYNSLLQELECTEINLSYVKNDIFRLDSFFYAKDFLKAENLISKLKTTTIHEMKKAKILSFGAYSLNNFVDYLSEGVPFIQCSDMKNGVIEMDNLHYISEKVHRLLYKSEVFPETVLISMAGTIGSVAISLPSWKYPINSNQAIAKIRLNGEMNPYYLYAFFLSKFGQIYMKREARGTVQQNIFLSQIENFKIPVPSEKFATAIEKICKRGFDCKESADEKYHAAEKILSLELGLENFSPSTENIAVKSFSSSFGTTGRLDAEFYQPKYDDIERKLKNFETTTIPAEYETFKNSGTNYAEGISDVGVIKTKQVTNQGVNVDGVESYFSDKTCDENGSIFLKNGDVIFASMGVGSLGKISLFMYDGDKKFVTDSTLKIYRVKKFSKVLPAVLCLFIQTSIAQEIVYKYVVGSTGIINIYDGDIAKIPIPILPMPIQEKISAQVEESFKLREESKRLLELAKRAVEVAIEEGEEAALKIL